MTITYSVSFSTGCIHPAESTIKLSPPQLPRKCAGVRVLRVVYTPKQCSIIYLLHYIITVFIKFRGGGGGGGGRERVRESPRESERERGRERDRERERETDRQREREYSIVYAGHNFV